MCAFVTALILHAAPPATRAEESAGALVRGFLEMSAQNRCTEAKAWADRFTPGALDEIAKAVGSLEAYCRMQTEGRASVDRVEIDKEAVVPTGEVFVRYSVAFANGDMRVASVYMSTVDGKVKWSRIKPSLRQQGTNRIRLEVRPSPSPR